MVCHWEDSDAAAREMFVNVRATSCVSSARLQTSRSTDRTLLSAHVLHSPYGQYDAFSTYRFSSAPLPPNALNTRLQPTVFLEIPTSFTNSSRDPQARCLVIVSYRWNSRECIAAREASYLLCVLTWRAVERVCVLPCLHSNEVCEWL